MLAVGWRNLTPSMPSGAERIPQLWPEWDAYRRRHLAQLRKADKPHEKHPKRTGAPRERTD